MLTLTLKDGGYFTVGDDIVIQIFRDSGDFFRVSIDAPREIPIVRGTVREREGGERPETILNHRHKPPSDRIHNAKQLEKYLTRKEAAKKEIDAE